MWLHDDDVPPDVLVCSQGGVASTRLMRHLQEHTSLRLNRPSGMWNPLKHASHPPPLPTVRCAVFVYGDVDNALLSLFHRRNDALHAAHAHDAIPTRLQVSPLDAWQQTVRQHGLVHIGQGDWQHPDGRDVDDDVLVEHRRRKAAREQQLRDLQTTVDDVAAKLYGGALEPWLSSKKTLEASFGWESQFAAWTTGAAAYPVLLLSYEALWTEWDSLQTFLELSNLPRMKKRERRSNWTTLPRGQQIALRDKTQALRGHHAQLQAAHVVRG